MFVILLVILAVVGVIGTLSGLLLFITAFLEWVRQQIWRD